MSFGGFIKGIFGTSHDRMMRKLRPIVTQIGSLEESVRCLSDEELKAQTPKFKQTLANGASLDDILPEAFATIREAGRRVLNMRHYDEQLIGGIVLHKGMIAEMKTGEGKTLVATSPMYLNALAGKGAHLVTVNDYLASRDADWMGQIYNFLGLSVGKILADLDNETRRKAYNCDITYGTNNEFGFDYLRDNMKYQLSDYVQRGHFFAIVDEVDSILIDEARTPLIISGQLEQDLSMYKEINKLVPFLKRDEDYVVDEKAQSVALNESGIEKIEKHMGIDNIYDSKYIEHLHHVNKALQAHTLYKRDQNYVVENGEVIIIDDFTGRMMHGRRWSDGLHQAIEAKEGVEIKAESQTLATITFQNYFRMYEKLAGMTGTADTEAEEFKKIYKLDVVCIPTAKKIIRKDYHDVIYFDEKAKINAIAAQIQECHAKGQPILVGTVSVEKSEVFSKAISKLGIKHNVLNAKNHKREAEIIAQAGRKGAVTIATNMAGRGTDILLGGNAEFLARQECSESDPNYASVLAKYKAQCAEEKEEVYEAGGLFILGTERHESRRIDNQLRGRAGRQGDPGASRFFLSLDDDLLRIFGGEELKNRMAFFGMEKQADVPIEASIVSRAVETAQKRVEGRNFDIRKNLIEYDDVMNAQRKSIYELRSTVLLGKELEDNVLNAFEDVTYILADRYMPAELASEDWKMDDLLKQLDGILGYKPKLNTSTIGRGDRNAHIELIWKEIENHYKKQVGTFNAIVDGFAKHLGDDSPYKGQTGTELLMELAQNYYLREIDHFWRAHLTQMTSLRESISLRGYAQKDPKQEYKREAYTLFEKMMENIKTRMMSQVCKVKAEMPDFSRMKHTSSSQVRSSQNENASSSREDNMNDLQSMMSTQRKKAQPAMSMAEIMAIAKESKPAPEDQTKRKISMAELMPASIAQAAAAPKSPEKPKAVSMADLLPASMRSAMLDAQETRRKMVERMHEDDERRAREEAEDLEAQEQMDESQDVEESEQIVEEAPKKPMSMADLMPASMLNALNEASETRRKMIERMHDDDERRAREEAEERAREERENNELIKFLTDSNGSISLSDSKDDELSHDADASSDVKAETSTVAENANDTHIADAAQTPAADAPAEKTEDSKKSDDILGSGLSSLLDDDLGLSSLDDFDDISLSPALTPASSDAGLTDGFSLSNNLLGNGDESEDKDDDNDPFGIFKNLGL